MWSLTTNPVLKLNCGVFAAIFFIFPTWAWGQTCTIPEIGTEVRTIKSEEGNSFSNWKILDQVIKEYHIEKAVKCSKIRRKNELIFLKNFIKKNYSGYLIKKKTDWFYAPASNYGHARVLYRKKEPGIYIKESFYLDFKGQVFVNDIFFMLFKNGNDKPQFFEVNYEEQRVQKKEKSCMRCHQTVSKQNFLFGKY